MDYSAANAALWNIVIQLGLIAGAILLCSMLRNKVRAIRSAMMPVAVMAGFSLLILKYTGLIRIDGGIMEILVYHGIALGFIAMSLRTVNKDANRRDKAALKSGVIIVSTYMVQGVLGLLISITLGCTLMPGLFKASGLLLPMGYGQGPGQANNVGTSYQNLGFAGGRSFGLAIAAAGYLCACVVGVILLNILARRGNVKPAGRLSDDDLSVGFFQDKNELPVADSIDRLSVQLALVLVTYLITYLAAWGLTSSWLFALKFQSKLENEFTLARDGMEDGQMFSDLFRDITPRPVIGVVCAGGIARTYDGRVEDLMGLNNLMVAHSQGERKGVKNHAAFEVHLFEKINVDVMPFAPEGFYNQCVKGLCTSGTFAASWRFGKLRWQGGPWTRKPMLISKRLLASLLERGDFEFQDTLLWNGSEWAPPEPPRRRIGFSSSADRSVKPSGKA